MLLLFQLLGCEPAIESVTISKYPDRLIYVVGYDTDLDLSGGELTFSMSFGPDYIDPMDQWYNRGNGRIIHNIDFNVPGVYVVEIKNYNGNGDKFTIQVVEKDYINNIIKKTTE
jgi:hypothetical protein